MAQELSDGQTVSLDVIRSGGLTYRGKPLEFAESDDNPNSYTAIVEFTDEEKDLGAQDLLVVYRLNNPVGTIDVSTLLPEGDEFEGLTDAEKYTKLNSLEYQTGKPEVTQLADGSQQSPIGIAALKSKAAKDAGIESYKKNSLNKEINSKEALKKASEAEAKRNKERKANVVEVEEGKITSSSSSVENQNTSSVSSSDIGSSNKNKSKQ
jgi:hypothetical protein